MRNISATAHLVAMYRALETESPDALFQDPFARDLAGREGALAVEVLGDKQHGVNAIAIRTCAIDAMLQHVIQAENIDTVLNLGAGLDTRPYRLFLPQFLRWIEVDLPAIVTYKEEKLKGHQPVCSLKRIQLDLFDIASRQDLFAHINQSTKQVLVITDGLLSYLTEVQVTLLATDLRLQSNFRWWLFDLAASWVRQRSQEYEGQTLFDQYFENENPTFLFAPEVGTDFFQDYGWNVSEFRSVWQESCRLKRGIKWVWLTEFVMRRFAQMYWLAVTRQSGFVLLEQE